MNEQELGQRIIDLTNTLYHVSKGLLQNESDREDAVQSAIERAWRKRATLRDDARLKPWLVRILVNECYTILRRRKREIPVESLPEGEDAQRPPEESALQSAVMALPGELRLPIVLHYVEGFSVLDIASALRCPKGTAISRLSRGRKRLKAMLTEEYGDDE